MLRIDSVTAPDGKMAGEVTELVRDTASPLLFNHSSRVNYFAALIGKRRELHVDPELLYVGGLTKAKEHRMSSMMAWRVHEFGSPDVMKFEQVPTPGPGEVLVKVEAAGVGP